MNTLERLNLKKNPDENLVMEFIIQADPEKADNYLVRFTEHAMREKLRAQRDKGFCGWNTPHCNNQDLLERLQKNLETGDYLDVINLAAMLLARKSMFTEKHLSRSPRADCYLKNLSDLSD